MRRGDGVGMGGRAAESHRKWAGVWYKPWTWFSYVWVIGHFEFIEVSLVAEPADPLCRITRVEEKDEKTS